MRNGRRLRLAARRGAPRHRFAKGPSRRSGASGIRAQKPVRPLHNYGNILATSPFGGRFFARRTLWESALQRVIFTAISGTVYPTCGDSCALGKINISNVCLAHRNVWRHLAMLARAPYASMRPCHPLHCTRRAAKGVRDIHARLAAKREQTGKGGMHEEERACCPECMATRT